MIMKPAIFPVLLSVILLHLAATIIKPSRLGVVHGFHLTGAFLTERKTVSTRFKKAMESSWSRVEGCSSFMSFAPPPGGPHCQSSSAGPFETMNNKTNGNSLIPKTSWASQLFPSPLQATTAAAGSLLASTLIMNDPATEAHVLSDVSHLGLDFAALMGQGLVVSRFAAILGRLCAMGADYLPDHTIIPEELVFQLAMLALSCFGLLRAAILPSAAAVARNISLLRGFGVSIVDPSPTLSAHSVMFPVLCHWIFVGCYDGFTTIVLTPDPPTSKRNRPVSIRPSYKAPHIPYDV